MNQAIEQFDTLEEAPAILAPARLTLITASKPQRLAKRYYLDGDRVAVQPAGALVAGHAERIEVATLEEFAALLASLASNQALTYGVAEVDSAPIYSRAKWRELGRPDDALTRTKDAFAWPRGAGILLADYDPDKGGEALSPEDLNATLFDAVPGLATAARVEWFSASSLIYQDDREVRGISGQRRYWMAKDATDIPRAAEALEVYLWAAGHGHIEISSSGAMLPRTLLDMSVWQPNRLDFAAGAACDTPLEQRRGAPLVVAGSPMLDTRAAIPDPDPAAKARAERAKREAKRAKQREADSVKDEYIEERALELAPTAGPEELEQAREVIRRALDNDTLAGDFPLTILQGGQRVEVTVGEVLDDPERYHGSLTLDPLEPDYQGGKDVGKLYLMTARPNLYSFAHGGRNFRLMRAPARVELVGGRTTDAVETTLSIMRRAPDIFDFGGPLVTVAAGRVHPLDEHTLRHWLGGHTQYWRWVKIKDNIVERLEDPPGQLCKTLLSLGDRRQLKPLKGIITAPTMRPDGSILDAPGYDAATGLLLEADSDDLYPVPAAPTAGDAAAALDRLMTPFKDFPLVSEIDRAVLLSAILTAAVRPALPCAPAFGFDAPIQGSGKTLMASCISIMATGEAPTVWPHTNARDDEEIRKRVLTVLMAGTRAVVWDNILGVFDSAALAATLTRESFTDRILGRSGSVTVPNRAIWLLTGNNLTLAGDMPRRVLKCRIDPQSERPYARQFDLDPEAYCFHHRQRMVADALTIIRAWNQAHSGGTPRAAGRMASFEPWDDLVRQPVAWLASHVPGLADPMEAVDAAQALDPEQEALDTLLTSLEGAFGSRQFVGKDVAEVVKRVQQARRSGFDSVHTHSHAEEELAEILEELLGQKSTSTRSIGRTLANRADRLYGGRRLVRAGSKQRAAVWKVQTTPG